MKAHKALLKKAVCYPYRITKEDIIAVSDTFYYEEIVHFIILASIIKMRIQLTYLSKKLYDLTTSVDN